ncbi:hypothetical protein [Hymenobacter pini]|uniref:hypothetical protein n=1 Tax=Hymenobacter pini TaxID=2880879 RepID=UPI001CF38A90|nr:hypothetical protein [Hymenobacter pini]MCA8829351.1 hypothetical protein [Hymenobacter pini]
MKYTILLSAWLLAACNPAQTASTSEQPAAPAVAEATTQEQAATIATRYFRTQTDSAEYLLPTLRVMDAGDNWQVLVKRRDRVGRMPDGSAIDIEKSTGRVSPVRVK